MSSEHGKQRVGPSAWIARLQAKSLQIDTDSRLPTAWHHARGVQQDLQRHSILGAPPPPHAVEAFRLLGCQDLFEVLVCGARGLQ